MFDNKQLKREAIENTGQHKIGLSSFLEYQQKQVRNTALPRGCSFPQCYIPCGKCVTVKEDHNESS